MSTDGQNDYLNADFSLNDASHNLMKITIVYTKHDWMNLPLLTAEGFEITVSEKATGDLTNHFTDMWGGIMMFVIQTAETQPSSDYLLLLSASLIALGLTLFIVFHAYQGYQRNSSIRILSLTCGLGFITVVPITLSIRVNSFGQMIDLNRTENYKTDKDCKDRE
ncbi:hypothetical protein [Halostagnicola kamekurae]|uniref:hypothetical protein n=1 Tax=Halostagnicola kamekurae TaxID=619731 RepID=UPI001587E912|nr:hypothetical protein [Halostagnicola kamekurae]